MLQATKPKCPPHRNFLEIIKSKRVWQIHFSFASRKGLELIYALTSRIKSGYLPPLEPSVDFQVPMMQSRRILGQVSLGFRCMPNCIRTSQWWKAIWISTVHIPDYCHALFVAEFSGVSHWVHLLLRLTATNAVVASNIGRRKYEVAQDRKKKPKIFDRKEGASSQSARQAGRLAKKKKDI